MISVFGIGSSATLAFAKPTFLGLSPTKITSLGTRAWRVHYKGWEVRRAFVAASVNVTGLPTWRFANPHKEGASRCPVRKVGLYLRVSTEEQAERGWSIGRQLAELRRFCNARPDWRVARVLKDPGYTAANLDRPGIQRLQEPSKLGPSTPSWSGGTTAGAGATRLLPPPAHVPEARHRDRELHRAGPQMDTPLGEFTIGMIGLIGTWSGR